MKDKFLNDYLLRNESEEIFQISLTDEEYKEIIKTLKEKYYEKCQEGISIRSIYKNHSAASEILSKIIMLVHEVKGLKGVNFLLAEINGKFMDNCIEELEKNEVDK